MSLDMMGMIDQDFETGVVTIIPNTGDYLDGEFVPGSNAGTTHIATKQVANSQEINFVNSGDERYTDVARFFINDGSVHSVGSTIIDAHGKEYRIADADCRPERNYCKLLGASNNE